MTKSWSGRPSRRPTGLGAVSRAEGAVGRAQCGIYRMDDVEAQVLGWFWID
jgi:hypothetical protein